MPRMTANLLLLTAAIVWGAAFVAQSTAMESIGPMNFTGVRFLLATLAVAPFAYFERRRVSNPIPLPVIGKGILVGVVFFAGMAFQQFGFATTSVTNAGFLTALYVPLTPVIGVLIFRSWPTPIIWPIVAISVLGAYLLAGSLETMKEGDILMLFSALSWALQIIFVGRMVSKYGNPLAFAFLQFATAGVLGFLGGLPFETMDLSSLQGAWFQIIYTGVFSGALAFGLQAIGQRYTPPADAAIILSGESVFAAIFGALLLSERLTSTQYLGCFLIFSCILLVELLPQIQKRLRRAKKKTEASETTEASADIPA
ncbi:DMT family transporter [uncultured Cohaesibacter sp.]|uniref:DMT family transporter n=1 Tax=uncultured Cohaesibacter sp. TaxID=1002546 RepID=UPI002AABB58D|nr:DMT family transporter [uncultured Cohaesibacter sp.]